ncbi:MAG: hypothetical protein GX652_06080, partial [Burkholderiaceae bacterium]|nr:hypothetical protein [Burkholderiaceae bacterium]
RVALRRSGAETRTDGNGRFELPFRWTAPEKPGPKGEIEFLELDKDGYQGRSVPILAEDWFSRPVAEKLEPNPVSETLAGFTVRMRTAGSIHGMARRLGADPNQPIPVEKLREGLAMARRSAANDSRDDRVEFYGYAPVGVPKLRAVFLVSLHGMGSVEHPVLRAFADREAVALVGVRCHPIQVGSVPLEALDPPLRRLGAMLGHAGLADLPVLTFGHSNGTGFATVFASERPERLIAWISYHSGYAWQLQLPGVERAPGLVLHGMQDEWFEHGQEQAVRELRGERNAPVALMVEAHVGHGPVNPAATWEFIVAFCEAALRMRLRPDGSLRPVIIEDGWLGAAYDRAQGGLQRLDIAPHAAYAGERGIANWLPDETFARIWQRYGETDPRISPRR